MLKVNTNSLANTSLMIDNRVRKDRWGFAGGGGETVPVEACRSVAYLPEMP